MSAISIRNVTKRYGRDASAVQVIHGVSAEIDSGEFIVIVGPSGCGKSTLLRMVAGLEEISGGEIAIGGKVVNDIEPADRWSPFRRAKACSGSRWCSARWTVRQGTAR